jgi:hypothetical protein
MQPSKKVPSVGGGQIALLGIAHGYPVVWCPREGEDHTMPSFTATAIAEFFQRF